MTLVFRLHNNAKATWVYYDQRLCYLSWKERLVWSREKIMKQFCVLWKSYACYKKRFSLLPSMCDGKTRNEKLLYKNTKIAILFFHLNYYGSLSLLYMYSIYIYIYIVVLFKCFTYCGMLLCMWKWYQHRKFIFDQKQTIFCTLRNSSENPSTF